MTADPLLSRWVELLTLGHGLYAGDHIEAGPADAPEELRRRADRLVRVTARGGERSARSRTARMADDLRRTSVADAELATLLADARAAREQGRYATGVVLADAHADPMPAADTPLGRREALRRMAARLRSQRSCIRGSRRRARLLVQRMRRLGYLPGRRQVSAAHTISLDAVRYDKSFAPGHTRQRIADALDHMGITDPWARHNWLRGYQTLIARESGGSPSVIASEPATTLGPTQPDGHGLGYARGMTQTIPATFARYHQPGTATNIYDPVANICASMNYVMHRYGVSPDGSNLVALVQQADAGRSPRGY